MLCIIYTFILLIFQMIDKIFTYLTVKDLKSVRLVCSKFYVISKKNLYRLTQTIVRSNCIKNLIYMDHLYDNPIVNLNLQLQIQDYINIGPAFRGKFINLLRNMENLKSIEACSISNEIFEIFFSCIPKIKKLAWTNLRNPGTYGNFESYSGICRIIDSIKNIEFSNVRELIIGGRENMKEELFLSPNFIKLCEIMSYNLQSLSLIKIPEIGCVLRWFNSMKFQQLEKLLVISTGIDENVIQLLYYIIEQFSGSTNNSNESLKALIFYSCAEEWNIDDVYIPDATEYSLDLSGMHDLQVYSFS